MQVTSDGIDGSAETTRLVSLFCALAAIPSPSGHEAACGDAVASELSLLGLQVERDGSGAAVGSDCDNLLCQIPATAPGLPLFFCAHLDTVPPTDELRPVVVDGIVRNATPSIVGADNKAAVAVVLDAVRTVVTEGIDHAGLELLFTIGEEQGLKGSHAFDASALEARSGFVFDHPGAIGGYVSAAPSRFIVHATMRGRASHSGISPQDGVNTIVPMARAIAEFPGSTSAVTVNVGVIHGGAALNVVPDHAQVSVDVRAIEHAEGLAVVEAIESTLRSAAGSSGCTLEVAVENAYLAYRLGADSTALRLASAAFSALGLTSQPVETHGGSDANVFCRVGLDCVNLTHGVADFHGPDEHVAVSDLVLMKDVVLNIIAAARSPREAG